MKKVNQIHPPAPKNKRVDSLGNSRKRVYLKSGNSTMLFCKGLTENGVKALEVNLNEMLYKLGVKLEGKLISTL